MPLPEVWVDVLEPEATALELVQRHFGLRLAGPRAGARARVLAQRDASDVDADDADGLELGQPPNYAAVVALRATCAAWEPLRQLCSGRQGPVLLIEVPRRIRVESKLNADAT